MTALITGVTDNRYILMLLIILFLVFLGMFMEGSIIIILTTPILLPIVTGYGVDPIVFGLIVSVIVTMGNLTPPVGVAMYTVCNILDIKMEDYVKNSLPFILAVAVEVTLMLVFPQMVLFIPNMLFK